MFYIKVKNPTAECTHVKVNVWYSKGGTNWYNARQERRGFYIGFSPVVIEPPKDGMWGCEKSLIGNGVKYLAEESQRDSKKKVAALAESVFADAKNKTGKVWEVATQIAKEANVELAEVGR